VVPPAVKEVIVRIRISLLVLVTVLVATGAVPAAGAERLTIDNVFSAELTSMIGVPRFQWLDGDVALLLDPRIDASRRTLELYDPATRSRKPAFPPEAFLAGLKAPLGDTAPRVVSWPSGIGLSGTLLLYAFAGDLFVWDVGPREWKRLTDTPEEETSAAFSPDGHWVSFIRGSDLYAVERESGREVRLTKDGSDTLLNGRLSWVYWEEIFGHTEVPYRWSPDSGAIAYLQTDESSVSVSTFVDFRPATQGVVRQRYPKAGQANPRVRLGVVELKSTATIWMDSGSHEYLARFDWLPGGKEIAFQTLSREQDHLRLFIAGRGTGRSRIVLEERQPAWINLNDALCFLKDGTRFIWLSERGGYQHLYLYSSDGTLIRPLTRGEFLVLSANGDLSSRNRGLVAVDEEAGWVYFTSNMGALTDRHLYRVRLGGSEPELLSRGAGVHAPVFSPSGRYYLETYSNCATPPELALHGADGRTLAIVTPSANEVLGRFALARHEMRTYPTADGLDIAVLETRPAVLEPGRKYPTLVCVYGGPGSQEAMNIWPSHLWDDLMAQEGYVSFFVEVRAGMAMSKAIETSSHRRAYGLQNVRDILDAVRWIGSLPYVDGGRLGLWGGSGGGCTTLFTMTHSDVFKAAVSLFPVSDWHYYDTIYTERYQDMPQDNPEGYAETSSVRAAGDLKGKLLIVHGTYDDNVHPQNTEAFAHELIQRGIPFEIMIYPWQKHGIVAPADQLHLRRLMLDFWNRNL
jgi:dipeptidyl-peptidase-4